MATFVLVHGAGDTGWYWHLAEAELRARGHDTIAPDLPCDNATASLDDYAGAVAEAAAARLDGGQTGNDDPLITYYDGVPRPLAEEALRRGDEKAVLKAHGAGLD
jgi:pimeloyl-ACP methyl ester carboxylesterase